MPHFLKHIEHIVVLENHLVSTKFHVSVIKMSITLFYNT